jgi:hypothetical protein
MGIIFWAADRLLATLHPPTRAYNHYCPSIREYSILSRNRQDKDLPRHDPSTYAHISGIRDCARLCKQYIATDVRHGEHSTLWRETHTDEKTVDAFGKTRLPGHFEPFIDSEARMTFATDTIAPEDSRIPLEAYVSQPGNIPFHRVSQDHSEGQSAKDTPSSHPKPLPNSRRRLNGFPRLRMPRVSEADQKWIYDWNRRHGDFTATPDKPAPDRGVWFGVEQIAGTKASCEVAQMLACSFRSNYNLQSYQCDFIGHPMAPTKRTIEWRQGAASMDANWVATWIKIVVGVSRFAVHAPPGEFLRVLHHCDYAEKGGSYDVLDLLEDMGLVTEAIIAGQRIQEYAGSWGLQFEDAGRVKSKKGKEKI